MTDEMLGMLGKYQVLEEIGRGGFSVVYRAEHPKLKKTVAIKLMLPALFSDPEAIQRFIQEARTVAALKQENITQVLDLSEEQGRLFMVMEYLSGGDLHAWVKKNGKPSFRRTTEVISAIAAALDYAHSQNVVHGDVKPGNILMNAEGAAKLTDFGVLRAVESSGVTSADMTRGTPYYISPEQAEGGRATPLSDQYALGVVAYELFTGRVPFEGETPLTIYLKHLREALPPASQINPLITPALEAVLQRALEKNPEKRFNDCRSFARALREAVSATETSQYNDLMTRAGAALAAHQPEIARPLIESALQIQPDDAQARSLLDELQSRERAQRGYQSASEALDSAKTGAAALRADPAQPDPTGLLARLAPPPPPAWKALLKRWQLGLWLALGLGLLGLVLGLGDVASTAASPKLGPAELNRQTLVAGVASSTPTVTLTLTPTSTVTLTPTPTVTLTLTPTSTSTSTPTPTVIGGGSGKIAYTSKSDIYTINFDGSSPINLTDNSAYNSDPAWSRDGNRIAFSSNLNGGKVQIFTMNADGSNVIQITHINEYAGRPTWSPDGEKIAFLATTSFGLARIYVIDAEGDNLNKFTSNATWGQSISWSPDGKRILFRYYYNGRIFGINPDGTNESMVVDVAGYNPSWSPDGAQIAFWTPDQNKTCVANADGTNINCLVTSSSGRPSWSPDGRRIAYIDNGVIYTMNLDGSQILKLSDDISDAYLPAWAP